ncbi:MAG: Lon protease 1 [Lentisphaerae bacterium ADurb.Bin242]|nr:MAG: Lon protease 1 [Lentisphaerae bacterium ADurb.Bin242]
MSNEEEKKHPNENITISAEGSSAEDETANDPGELVESTVAPAISQPGMILFPFALTPLVLDNPKVISLIEKAAAGDRLITVFPEMPDKDSPMSDVQGIELNVSEFDLDDKKVSATGVLCRLVKSLRFPDGTVRVLMRGLSRVRFVESLGENDSRVRVERLAQTADNSIETVAMVRNAVKQFQEIISFSPNFPEELKIAILNLTDNTRIVDLIADTINISYLEKLAILTLPALQERLHLLTILLNREVEVLRLGSEIQSQVHNAMSKSQREFFLREQLRTIKEELGEGTRNPDVVNIQERMGKLDLPEKVAEILKKEIERLDMIPQAAAEYNIAYTYIDWLLSVPWNNFTEDRLDVREAARILDRDHYGLKDIKERILEFLAVLQLKKDRKSPIICFVGPPGVGKTSLGKSIAEAMGRKFVRMSLGGIRDEAEIRGHRRTYIGALPGRIIQGLKKAGSSNPVFMLDEIDKLGNDFRGDPAAALLEVLDPQQNHAFNDHYLEVDYDLSSVMFIATANITETIPDPLLDRMDIVRLPGYTATEKLHIAEQFLIPRQLKENGFTGRDVSITADATNEIISYYTREAGVRQLERTIGQVLRKLAREIVEGKRTESKTVVDVAEIHTLLGARKFLMDEAMQKPEVGVATGMAWTSVGGTILQVEAVSMPGKGELKLTGSLGDIMKESAVAAFSYVKGHSKELGIDPALFTKRDFHIHVPDGATPKDGPSAGVTLATALISLLTGKPVRTDYAMTGEINLRGKVTVIGGVKEKAIGALRAGIKNIILPMENKKDLEDIPEDVLNQVHFHFASTLGEVLEMMLLNPPGTPPEAAEKTASAPKRAKIPKPDTK